MTVAAWVASFVMLADGSGRPPAGPPVVYLVQVRRIHVEKLNGEGAAQIRDMIIAALENTRQFVLTEDPERADALLRGSAEDLVFTETFQSGESLHANASIGAATTGTGSTRRGGGRAALGVSESENTRIHERKHEASAAVRLVSRDGDVLWSTTQESLGAKFRSAAADVADRVARKLVGDVERLRKPAVAKP
jgi:hypothetical protein